MSIKLEFGPLPFDPLKVTDENGNDITKYFDFTSIKASIDVKQGSRLSAELARVKVEGKYSTVDFVIRHPQTGELKKVRNIEFDDGSSIDFDNYFTK